MGALEQAMVPKAGMLLFFFLSFSLPSPLAAAPCETVSLLQCLPDAYLSCNFKDLGYNNKSLSHCNSIRARVTFQAVGVASSLVSPCSVKCCVSNKHNIPLEMDLLGTCIGLSSDAVKCFVGLLGKLSQEILSVGLCKRESQSECLRGLPLYFY